MLTFPISPYNQAHKETNMGCGPIKNGKPQPITPYYGSWAWQQEQDRLKKTQAKPEKAS